jgi:hypothetical protein
MKIYLFILCVCAFANVAYSQGEDYEEIEFEDNELKNREIKLNLVGAPWGYVSVAYEQLFYKYNFSAGVEIGRNFADVLDLNYDVTILPYIRTYFGQNHKGFFVEGHYAIAQFRESGRFGNQNCFKEINEVLNGPGGAIGLKYINPNGFMGEVFLGSGANLSESDSLSFRDAYLRVGITIGMRLW